MINSIELLIILGVAVLVVVVLLVVVSQQSSRQADGRRKKPQRESASHEEADDDDVDPFEIGDDPGSTRSNRRGASSLSSRRGNARDDQTSSTMNSTLFPGMMAGAAASQFDNPRDRSDDGKPSEYGDAPGYSDHAPDADADSDSGSYDSGGSDSGSDSGSSDSGGSDSSSD